MKAVPCFYEETLFTPCHRKREEIPAVTRVQRVKHVRMLTLKENKNLSI